MRQPIVLALGLPADTADWLQHQLERIEVRAHTESAPASRAMRTLEPSLLIVTERLTDAPGEDLVAEARSIPALEDVPIIFCLAKGADPSLALRLVHAHRVERLMAYPAKRPALVDYIREMVGIEQAETDPAKTRERKLATGVAALWARFRGQVLQRVSTLENAGLALSEGRLDEEDRRAAEREAHKLAGSVGTFGFIAGSALARKAEQLLTGSRTLEPQQVVEYNDMVRRLRSELDTDDPRAATATEFDRCIETLLVVDAEPEFGQAILATAAQHGVAAVMTNSSDAPRRLMESRPELVIIDASATERWAPRLELLRLLAASEPPIPALVIGDEEAQIRRAVISERPDNMFVRRPVTAEEVFAQSQRMLEGLRPERGRILVVDDDPQVLEVVRSMLRRDGYEVKRISDPLLLMPELELQPPDLLILDLDMPHLNGIELCWLVRGHPSWQSVPIVLLTAHRETEVVQRVFAAGADDYVLKPLVGPELLTRVANRLERARLYRAMAETDPMTGVANRRKSTDQFHQLHRLAMRNNRPLTFAILDLDRFKQINDRFGHGIGDVVLREFASFLLKTFREEDVVGRWGGEEFILGLYGMPRDTGIRRLSRAIEDFQGLPISDGEGGEIHVTFSAGLAEYPRDGHDLQTLYLAADRALYGAKAAGRARVHGVAPEDRRTAQHAMSIIDTEGDDLY